MVTNKIFLSGLTAIALLMSGCTEEEIAKAKAEYAAQQPGQGSDGNSGDASGETDGSEGTSESTMPNNPVTETLESGASSSGVGSGSDNGDSGADNGDGDSGADNGDGDSGADNGDGDSGADNGNGNGEANTGDGWIPSPGNGADIPTTSKTEGGWYGRTVVTATLNGKEYRHGSVGVFGELVESDEAIDKHDIPAYGASIIRVVFPQEGKDYFTHYKGVEAADKSWEFQIKNQQTVNLKDAEIRIDLSEVKRVRYVKKKGKISYTEEKLDNKKRADFVLVDVDNKTTYTMDELKSATLTMQGMNTRTFKWVLNGGDSESGIDYSSTNTNYPTIPGGGSTSGDISADSIDASSPSISTMSVRSLETTRAVSVEEDTPRLDTGFNEASVEKESTPGGFGLPPM